MSKTKTARKRDPDRTSAMILRAAVKEFTEKGYGGARIEAITRRARVNKRSIYYHFGDKKSLYLAVLEKTYFDIRSEEAKLNLSDVEPEIAIADLCRFTFSYFLRNPAFISLLNTENLLRAKNLRKSVRIFSLHSPLVSTLDDVLARGAKQGKFRNDADPVHVYLTIASIGYFYLSNRWTLSAVFARDFDSEEEIEKWGKHMIEVVLGYLRR